jgi:signal transduction histidine kinase
MPGSTHNFHNQTITITTFNKELKVMIHHKLLHQQLKKYFGNQLPGDEKVLQFIGAINESYHAFDKSRELSDHNFSVNKQEFDEINALLKEEIELRKQSILKLKYALRELNPDEIAGMIENDDLAEIVDTLKQEIAKRKEAEIKMLLAKEEADKALQAKSEFLNIMSHEIRTPLNVVIGTGHLLLKSNPRPDQLENLKMLKTSADNLLVLVDDILDFNRIEAGKLELEENTFSLEKLASEIIGANTFIAQEKENKIELNIDPNLPSVINSDPHRLGQVLNHLVSNAVKFTSKGLIKVTIGVVEKKGDSVVIRILVADTGIGIEQEKQKYLFTPFMQSSTAITRNYGGTGLGLAITKRILELFNSEIKVISEVGKGSTFEFTVELKTNPTKEMDNNIQVETETDFKNKRILLVEDTLMNVLVASQLLEGWNAEVVVAENGLLAVEKARKEQFDLVLMDLQMPVMDGYTATFQIREFNKTIPIIALTAADTSNIREKVLAVGMQDFITKPLHPDEFFHRLKKYLA